ncbi:hypothetical protein LOD99_5721 [Oopsacas minuta]|uniref:Uncharacterized protein n=1 Tax=Oopsacas minuta TaxID=111878 RepID=A0AAV7JQ98_9METZ|nr:hypothetical protein LOD99_5721 [Oopsacas minuta]
MATIGEDNFELGLNRKRVNNKVEEVKTIDYTRKKQPIVNVSRKGYANVELDSPFGVTIDHQTGNIYIADYREKSVMVFDSTAKYLFRFGDSNGKGEMNHPSGLAICGNRILISLYNHCILNYTLDGLFISKIGKYGNGELEFSYPFSLTMNESNEDIYICDYYSNIVQILTKDFHFKSQSGRDILKYPLDVKVFKKYIYIIDESNPCLHIFEQNLILLKSVILEGKECKLFILASFL